MANLLGKLAMLRRYTHSLSRARALSLSLITKTWRSAVVTKYP